tara:strand:- start:24 stop:206 length:183 start_codon:yes stop_codon:yes gene_type:complete
VELIDFQDRKWRVIAKVEGHRIGDPSTLKESYRADLILRNSNNIYFILEAIIDAEFKDVN